MQSDCTYEIKELVPRSCFVTVCIINTDEGQTTLTEERVPRMEMEQTLVSLYTLKVENASSYLFQFFFFLICTGDEKLPMLLCLDMSRFKWM